MAIMSASTERHSRTSQFQTATAPRLSRKVAYEAITNTGTIIAIYARISSDKDSDEDGVRRQISACHKLAAKLAPEFPGCTVEVYCDNDISAVADWRPDYARLNGDIAGGRVKILVAWSTSRIYRHTEDERDMQRLMIATGTLLQTIKGGRLNYSTADGRAHARDEASLNQRERERISENTLASKQDDAEQGKWRGGTVPLGYARDPQDRYNLILDQPRADAVREAVEGVLAGRSVSAVTRTLNARLGTTMRPTAVRLLLRRRSLAGLIERNEVVVGEALWEGIITREQSDQVRDLLDDPARKQGPGPARKHLGSGLFRASRTPVADLTPEEIAALPTVLPSGARKPRNTTPSVSYAAPGVNRNSDLIDAYVQQAISLRLGEPETVEELLAGLTPASTSARAELEALRARRRNLLALVDVGEIDEEDFLVGTRRSKARIAELEAELEAATKVSPAAAILGAEDPVAQFAKAEVAEQRSLIDLICTVVLLPGKPGRPAGWKAGDRYATTSGIEILWKV